MIRLIFYALSIALVLLCASCADNDFEGHSSSGQKTKADSEQTGIQTNARTSTIEKSELDIDSDNAKGGTIGSSGGAKSPCEDGIVEDMTTLFQTPTVGTYGWGHHHRDDYAPGSDRFIIINFVNDKCKAGLTAQGVNAGVLSTERMTRDAVCQLYGYLEATENFTHWYFRSPDNNHIAYYDGDKFTEIYDARNRNGGQLLSKAECRGKVKDACLDKILNVNSLKCLP